MPLKSVPLSISVSLPLCLFLSLYLTISHPLSKRKTSGVNSFQLFDSLLVHSGNFVKITHTHTHTPHAHTLSLLGSLAWSL